LSRSFRRQPRFPIPRPQHEQFLDGPADVGRKLAQQSSHLPDLREPELRVVANRYQRIGHRAARAAGAGERCARACGRRSRFSSRALADEASDRICKNQRGTLMDERTTLLAADSVDTAAGDLTPEAIEQSIASWLKSYLADLLDLRVDQVDEEMTFDRF